MPVRPSEVIWDVLAEPDSYEYWVVGSKRVRDAEPGSRAGQQVPSHDRVRPLDARRSHRGAGRRARRAAAPAGEGPAVRDRGGDAADDAEDGGTWSRSSRTRTGRSRSSALNPLLQVLTKLRNAESLMRLEELALRRAASVKGSVWLETGPPAPGFPNSTRHVDADVAVIGGGIVGVTPRLLLQEAARVVLIEANRIGHGVTGHTTAKVSSQHGLIYAQLASKHGAEAARAYGAANEAALEWIAAASSATASTATSGAGRPTVLRRPTRTTSRHEARGRGRRGASGHARRRHAAAVRRRGRRPLRRPGRVPRRASTCWRWPSGCRATVYERTRAVQVAGDRACARRAARSTADHVVVATHFPFPTARWPSPACTRSAPTRRLPDRGRAAGGHVHQRRARRRARSAPCRRRARSCCSSAARATRPARRRHRGALRRARGVRARALGRAVGRRTAGRRRTTTTLDGAAATSASSRRSRSGCSWPPGSQVGHDRRHGRGADPRRPRARPREPVGGAVRPEPARRRAPPRRRSSRRTPRSACASSATALTKRGRRPSRTSRPARATSSATRGEKVAGYRDEDGTLARRLAALHPPGLPGQLERRRAQLGLPLPRLALRARRHRPRGPRGPPPGGKAHLKGTVPLTLRLGFEVAFEVGERASHDRRWR